MSKEFINPPELFNTTEFGFSQIVKSEPGKHVYLSGQVAWDENRQIVGKGDLAIQTQQTIDNLKTAMELAGGGLADIVMLRIYIVNYQSEQSDTISKALLRNFDNDRFPASTWIAVQGLANPDFLIEIEAEGVI